MASRALAAPTRRTAVAASRHPRKKTEMRIRTLRVSGLALASLAALPLIGAPLPATDPNGMVFVWENSRAANHLFDADDYVIRSCAVVAKGRSRIGMHYVMDCRDGRFDTLDSSGQLLAACKATGQLSVELELKARIKQGSELAGIVTFADGVHRPNFILGQQENALWLHINLHETKAPTIVRLGKIEPGRQYHVAVSYRPGLLEWFIDGKPGKKDISGDFKSWEPAKLAFGNTQGGGHPWNGSLRGVRIFNRVLIAEKVAARHKAAVKRRDALPETPSITAKVRLLNMSKPLTVKQLIGLSYYRCLVTHEYEVLEVINGTCDAKRVKVATWAILDRVAEPARRKGEVYTMRLEPWSAHKELHRETITDEIEDFDLPEFVEIEW
jgi:hypothetical protein